MSLLYLCGQVPQTLYQRAFHFSTVLPYLEARIEGLRFDSVRLSSV